MPYIIKVSAELKEPNVKSPPNSSVEMRIDLEIIGQSISHLALSDSTIGEIFQMSTEHYCGSTLIR